MPLRSLIALTVGLLATSALALDVDSGMDAIKLAQALRNSELGAGSSEHTGGWVRLRGIDLSKVPETREALLKLRSSGIRTCVFLRRSVKDWKVSYLPADLSEAYEHGRKLGTTYGDLVDAWEVDNEPDLGFVPESAERYTAFLKATYLGLKAGAREQRKDGGRQTSDVSPQPAGSLNSPQVSGFRSQVSGRAPLVLMGSLGLPPGPWLERFAANDGFAYTDGYNYHYYGYAEDFTGVYEQHEAAVKELTSQVSGFRSQVSSASADKDLPVFMTEIGYGMLGKSARDTKEGRLRQWRWFKSVGEQIATLRPEAPMAFYVPPYLEYDTSEYGLTVPAKQETEKAEGGKLKAEKWIAGGIEYTAEDFVEVGRVVPNAPSASDPGGLGIIRPTPKDWMNLIGADIGGNQVTPALAQWLAIRRDALSATPQVSGFRSQVSGESRPWSVTTARPSPVVIDFLPGEGLSHVKRYNGSFVTGREPPVHKKPETGRRLGVDGEANLKPEDTKPKPQTADLKPQTPPTRAEEFILQIRTKNGNLYEVYPTRQAKPDWERFLEPGNNFTMAFYGRAALPWRFKDNKPASLVVVMYPKSLPATYEFRRPQLIKLGAGSREPGASAQAQVSGFRFQVSPSVRYGSGTVVLYNFSNKPVSGRLVLPEAVGRVIPNAPGIDELIILKPNERREIPVTVKVPWDRYTRIEAPITFVPEDTSIPPARFLTSLIPDVAGLPATLAAQLLAQRTDVGGQTTEGGKESAGYSNREIVLSRPRASEEAPMAEQAGWFAQPGATVQPTADGFSLTVSSLPPGKPQRIEVEIPWPNGLAFREDEFLSVEFRLR